jgi:hypothetical protein
MATKITELMEDEPRNLLADIGVGGEGDDHPDDAEPRELLVFVAGLSPLHQPEPPVHEPVEDPVDRCAACRELIFRRAGGGGAREQELGGPEDRECEYGHLVEQEEQDIEVGRASEPLLLVH